MIHIAVLLKPYLDLILSGEKTVECRLTVQARDPFERIERGERIYFKQSSGPFAATATADHVLFESDLTWQRVNALKRDYNDLIMGDDAFWKAKRHARYCSLIWLKAVLPTDTGPRIRPLQGVAWLCLDEEPAWRRVDAPRVRNNTAWHGNPRHGHAFEIVVTEGNLRNNTLYVTNVMEQLPSAVIGGARRDDAAQLMTLMLHDGPTVHTDVVGHRKLIRSRVWGSWFRKHSVRPGDRVIFTPVDERTYFVGLARDET